MTAERPHKPSPQQRANLRVCASCKWVFRGLRDCPKCGFVSYGAHWVYDNRAYQYAKTQEPWMKMKLWAYEDRLLEEISRDERR